jgi:DNA-binding transcriptional regulator YhcF (GntR family)
VSERVDVIEVMRQRLHRALHAGAIRPGDRLPSTRELAAEFREDHRVILAAYRALADEGLVELRPRGGAYATAGVGENGALPLPAEGWLTGILSGAVARGIPLPELHDWLRRAVGTLRLRAAVIATTPDQIDGIRRELLDDYGIESEAVSIDALEGAERTLLRHVDLLVTTPAHETVVTALASRLKKPHVVASVRPDLIGGEWRLLLRQPVYVIVRDERFAEMLTRFFAGTPGRENLCVVVVGRDDLAVIPDGAPTYVTRSARDALGDVRIRGSILPAARVFSADASRALVTFVVRANLEAMSARLR